MLAFLRSFFNRPATPAAAGAAIDGPSSRAVRDDANAASPAIGTVAPAPTPPRAARSGAAGDEAFTFDGLAHALADRAARLAALFPDATHADVRAVAASLAADPAATIRQLPAAAQQALALVQTAEPGVPRLVFTIERDPTLAQSVLRHANSALHAGTGRPCYAVAEAIGRIGVAGVKQAVLAYTMEALICRPDDPFAAMSRQVWEHSARTSSIARALAPAFGADADEAASLALLHDVGKLLVFDRIATLRSEAKRDLQLAPDAVRVLLREFHEPLGGLAMYRWSLGAPAARAVAAHHRAPAPATRDPLGETLFVAEAADLALERGVLLDLEPLWITGGLAGSAADARAALARFSLAPV